MQGDTFENIANDLDCVVKTGTYIFTTTHETLNYTMLLHYNIPSQPHTSQNQKLPSEVEIEKWNIDQIGEFVRKLGFLDRDKGGGDQLKCFLKINEVSFLFLTLGVCAARVTVVSLSVCVCYRANCYIPRLQD